MFDDYRKLFLLMLIFSIRRKYNEHSMSSDGVLNSLVGRVQKEIDWFVVKVKCGIARVTRFIMVMKTKQIDTKPKNWELTSKQELVQAIEELNILSDDDLVSDISKTEKQWNLKRVKHRRESLLE